jgi:hypothetical protein
VTRQTRTSQFPSLQPRCCSRDCLLAGRTIPPKSSPCASRSCRAARRTCLAVCSPIPWGKDSSSRSSKIADRGGVLGAMETGYQRSQIQQESMHYEMLKHTGEYPIIGVNTFRNPHGDTVPQQIELARSTEEEKQGQLTRLRDFHRRHAAESGPMLRRLQQAVIDNANVLDVLMDAVRVCSLGQITNALFEVGGQYRRSM